MKRATHFFIGVIAGSGLWVMAVFAGDLNRLNLRDTTTQDTTAAPLPSMPKIPTGSNVPNMQSAPSQDSFLPPLAPPSEIRSSPTASTLIDIPSPAQSFSSSGIKAPILKSPADIKKPKISQPKFEEDYLRWMLQEQTKKLQRKRLGESLLDEIKRYGLLILLGIVAILVLFALKKETAPVPPASEDGKDTSAAEKKDIWDDKF